MSSEHLARIFFRNWIKTPGKIRDLSSNNEEFIRTLTGLGCVVNPPKTETVNAATLLDWPDSFSNEQAFACLTNCRKSLAKDGIFFIRMKEDLTWNLSRFLELLSRTPLFTVAETYVLNGERDYLLRPIEKRPRIGIGMIAKNEERDLPRCLESLEGVADGIVFLDTGSVDKTIEVAQAWALSQKEKNPEFLFEIDQYLGASEKDEKGDWKLWNFGKARNEYVRKIEALGFDYVLWMDADDKLLDKKIKNLVFLDQYMIHGVQIESGGLRWPHHRLWKANQGVKYSGWCHEYPGWSGFSIIHTDIAIHHDAAPGLGENSNDRNLRILKRELEAEPNARTAFYLANTYKDRGAWLEAVEYYQRRMDFGLGYADEYWFAVLYKARCQRLSKQLDEARLTLMQAIQNKPTWAEFWMELSYLETALGNHWKAISWALQAKDMPIAPTQLFREKDKYTDQPYRVISWAYQHLGEWEQAIAWALLARDKISNFDADWENRISQLKERVRKKPEARVVVWHRPGALGDVLMTLNLVKLFKEKNPKTKVIYKTHASTLSHLKPLILAAGIDEVISTEEKAPCDKEINLIGYPLHEGYPNRPMKKHLLEYFSEELGLNGEVSSLILPLPKQELSGDYLTLHVKAGWSMYKEWGLENWKWVCEQLYYNGIQVVQIGGPTDPKLPFVFDRVGTTLMESLALQAHAKLHVGIDSWTNHATNIFWEGKGKTPGVILWGSTQSSATGYEHNRNISANLPCQPCFREDPKISKEPRGVCPYPKGQTYEEPRHLCMQSLRKEDVLEEILEQWSHVTGFDLVKQEE